MTGSEVAVRVDSAGRIVRSETPPAVLDAHVTLLEAIAEAKRNEKFWVERHKLLKEKLAEVMGAATVGTVDGREVVRYNYVDSFRGTEFAKAYPNFHRIYTRPITKEVFDPELLRMERPDLYAEFQSRPMNVSWVSAAAESF